MGKAEHLFVTSDSKLGLAAAVDPDQHPLRLSHLPQIALSHHVEKKTSRFAIDTPDHVLAGRFGLELKFGGESFCAAFVGWGEFQRVHFGHFPHATSSAGV